MARYLGLTLLAGLFSSQVMGESPGPTAPELSTGAVYTGAIILIGGILMLADWLRKRKNSVA